MNSKGFYDALAVLRGRTWTLEEAMQLLLLVKTGYKVKEEPVKVTHILVGPSDMDSQMRDVIHFHNVEDVKRYIEAHPEIINSTSTLYKVDVITPKRTVTIDVSL